MKVLLGFVIAIVVIAVIIVGVLGYLGFMPGVSNLFGSNKPKDLGVTFTANDLKSARAKTGTVITDLPSGAAPQDSIKFGTPRQVNATFTQAEFNALINNHPWEYYPLKDCQFKINPDGTAEFSGVLMVDRLQGAMQALGVSQDNMKVLNDYLKAIPGNPAVYIKGNASVVNNQVSTADVSDFKLGNMSFTKQVQDNESSLTSAAETMMRTITGMNVQSFNITPAGVQFKGTLPDIARSK